nr:hypothetical protein BaRGS_016833 [Batillaria attramentaria]
MEEIAKAGATTAFELLHKTGLDRVIAAGYFTLFIPTNKAFEQLPAEVQDVVNSNMTALTRILQYHATSHIFRSADAFNDLKLVSEMGQEIWINLYRQTNTSPLVVTAEGSEIIRADVMASNGYLHIVDRVMLPPVGNLYDLIQMSGELSTLKSLVDAAGLKNELINGVTYINHAKVLLGDVPATNGVMHVLDKVLVPPRYATSIVGK